MTTRTLKRYAIAGTGVRGLCFARALTGASYAPFATLVGLYDRNPERMRGFCGLLKREIPYYTDFARMAREAAPTHLIVTTPDNTHADMVELAFAYGLDAVVEKPMATTVADTRRILEAERSGGRKIRVTFNYRFATFAERLKKALREADIGTITSVNLEWLLDKYHGAEYFRRWHADRQQSGGLFVHKATHHFDLVNWLIEDAPESVAAFGALRCYGKNGTAAGTHCRVCPAADRCAFRQPMDAMEREYYEALYFGPEATDGYIRDRCVFRDEIDIYDTMNAVVRYRGGAQLSYALTAYAPYEGYTLALTGTQGRLEASETHRGMMMKDGEGGRIRVVKWNGAREPARVEEIPVAADAGDHGGGDPRLYRHMVEDNLPDPLDQNAGSAAGAMSCLIGICANASAETGQVVAIPALDGLGKAMV